MSQPQVSVEGNFANYSPKTISSVCFKESQLKVFCQELSSNHCAAIDEECRGQNWPRLCVQIDVPHTSLNSLLSKSRSWSLCIWSSHTEGSTALVCASWERESEILGPLCLVSGNKDAIRQMAICGQTWDNDRLGDYQAQTGKAPVQCL